MLDLETIFGMLLSLQEWADSNTDINRRLQDNLDNLQAIYYNSRIELGIAPDWPLRKCVKCKKETMNIVSGFCPDHRARYIENWGEKLKKWNVILEEKGKERSLGTIEAVDYPEAVALLRGKAIKNKLKEYTFDQKGQVSYYDKLSRRVYLKPV